MFSDLSFILSCVHNEMFIGHHRLLRRQRMPPVRIETQAQFWFPTYPLSVHIATAHE
jgi:hypothetical protein